MPVFTHGIHHLLVRPLLVLAIIGSVLGSNGSSLAQDWQLLSGADLKATVADKTWKARYWRVYWGSDGQRLHWSQDTKRVNEETWQVEPDGKTICADSDTRGRLCIQVEQRDEKLRAVELEGPYAGQKLPFKLLDGKVDF